MSMQPESLNPPDAVRVSLALDAKGPEDLPLVAAAALRDKDFIIAPAGNGGYVVVAPLPMNLTPENREKLIRYYKADL